MTFLRSTAADGIFPMFTGCCRPANGVTPAARQTPRPARVLPDDGPVAMLICDNSRR
jgi:hypothetical protein